MDSDAVPIAPMPPNPAGCIIMGAAIGIMGAAVIGIMGAAICIIGAAAIGIIGAAIGIIGAAAIGVEGATGMVIVISAGLGIAIGLRNGIGSRIVSNMKPRPVRSRTWTLVGGAIGCG
jgi:hypothetical protein